MRQPYSPQPYSFIYGLPQSQPQPQPFRLSVGVRKYNPRIDDPWAIEVSRLSRALRVELGIHDPPSGCETAAETIDCILAEFASTLGATHVFEASTQGQVFAAIATRLAVLPDPDGAAVIICGFIGKQLTTLNPPESLPPSPQTFRVFQSALFLAFLAAWVSRRGLSSQLEYAVKLLAKSSMVAK